MTVRAIRRLALLAALLAASLAAVPGAAAQPTTCLYGVAPAIASPSATVSGTSSATVTATINPNGCTTTYFVQYGTTTAYGADTTSSTLAASATASAVSVAVTGLAADTKYYYRVVADNADGTVAGSAHTFTTEATCAEQGGKLPGVTTRRAASVTTTTATLTGSINPHGCAVQYAFQYGTSTGYGATTAVGTDSALGRTTTVKVPISGLTPGTTYHFRLIATSAVGPAYGTDGTFTTPTGCEKALRPAAATQPASSVAATSATLNGLVTTNDCRIRYAFEYGRTSLYGSTTHPVELSGASGVSPASTAVAGLTPDTTYHFRIVAEGPSATVDGRDVTFRTASASGGATLAIHPGRVPVRHGRARFRLTCAGTGSCSGTLAIDRGARGIGHAGYSVSAGGASVVRVRLTGHGRRLLRRHGRLRVKVVAHDDGARIVTFVTLLLR